MRYLIVLALVFVWSFAFGDTVTEDCKPESSLAKAVKPLEAVINAAKKSSDKKSRNIAQTSEYWQVLKGLIREYLQGDNPEREAFILEAIKEDLQAGMNPNTIMNGKSLLWNIGIANTTLTKYRKLGFNQYKLDVDKRSNLLRTILENSLETVNLNIKDGADYTFLSNCFLNVNGEAAGLAVNYVAPDGKKVGVNINELNEDDETVFYSIPRPPTAEDTEALIYFFEHLKNTGIDINTPEEPGNKATYAYEIAEAHSPRLTKKMISLGMSFAGYKDFLGPISSTFDNAENFKVIVESPGFDLHNKEEGKSLRAHVKDSLDMAIRSKSVDKQKELNIILKYLDAKLK